VGRVYDASHVVAESRDPDTTQIDVRGILTFGMGLFLQRPINIGEPYPGRCC